MRSRVSRSVVSSLVLVSLLSVSAPVMAAPRDRDQPGWEGPLPRLVRLIKKVFTVASNGDGLIIPRP